MFAVLLVVLLVALCAAAPFLGADSSDARSEGARPEGGWYPATPAA